ncbi:MAG: substrate-binding domain-containing protein [Gluconacetobacter diazotrophicus]|nr:substrate-binding domain-containing protein [Gluconacetobacter diazotrophicus]
MTRARLAAGILLLSCLAAVAGLWPARRNTLVIYSAMGPPGPEIAAFERQTGIAVRYVNMNGNALLARIYAEGRRPGWDMAWFVGDAAGAALDRAGLLRRNWSGIGPPAMAAWTAAARGMIPADGSMLPTGLLIAGVFATRRTSPPPAPDWTALRSWPGTVGLVSPALSGTAFPVLSGMMAATGGVGPGHALLLALGERDAFVAPSNPILLRALRAGAVSLAVLPSEAAFNAAAHDPGLRVTVPEPAPVEPAVLAVSAAAGPAAVRAAARLARFLLAPHGQALLRSQPAEGLQWPVDRGTTVPAILPALDASRTVHPDPDFWGGREGREVAWFRRTLGGGG